MASHSVRAGLSCHVTGLCLSVAAYFIPYPSVACICFSPCRFAGWKVITTDGKQSLRQEWRAKDAAAAAQIAKRLADVAASEGYTPAGINAQGDIVIVELTNGPLGECWAAHG